MANSGTFGTGTATGTLDVAHGLGEAPSLVLFFWGVNTAAGTSGSWLQGVGWGVSATERGTHASHISGDFNRNRQSNVFCIVKPDASAGANDGEADYAGADATNFTIDRTSAFGADIQVSWIAFTSSEVSNVAVGNDSFLQGDDTTGASGLGFQPNCLLTACVGSNSADADFSTSTGGFNFGMTDGATSHSVAHANDHFADPTDTWSQMRTDRCMVGLNDSGTLSWGASFSSFDAGGFTLTVEETNSDVTPVTYHWLSVEFANVALLTEAAQTSTGTFDSGAVGFTPTALLQAVVPGVTTSSTGGETHAQTAFGGSTGEAGRSHAGIAEDGISGGDVQGRHSTTKVLSYVDDPTSFASVAEMGVSSLADPITWDMTDADDVASLFGVLAVGGSSTTPVSQTEDVRYESLFGASATESPFFEALGQITAGPTTFYESLNQIAASRQVSAEWLKTGSSEGSVPIESLLTLSVTKGVPVEWLAQVAQTEDVDLEALLSLAQTEQVYLEWTAATTAISETASIDFESLEGVASQRQVSTEWLLQLAASPDVSVEWLEKMSTSEEVADEWLMQLSVSGNIDDEWLTVISSTLGIDVEWEQSFVLRLFGPFTMTGEALTRTMNSEDAERTMSGEE